MGRADGTGTGSGALPQRDSSFRFRDDIPPLLERARAAVAGWYQEHPLGTVGELLAAIGGDFPQGYHPVLRARLAVLQHEADKPVRAMKAVIGWRERNPEGTTKDMLAEIGAAFPGFERQLRESLDGLDGPDTRKPLDGLWRDCGSIT
jgi:hypothetical protein